MWTNFRYRLLRALRELANVPEAAVAPKWIKFCYAILFPLNWLYERNSGIHYDAERDIYTIHGMKFSGDIFYHFKHSVGMKFEIDESDDGIVILRQIQSYEFFRETHKN